MWGIVFNPYKTQSTSIVSRAGDKRVGGSKTKPEESSLSSSPTSDKPDKKDARIDAASELDKDSNNSKGAKKRRGNSRTPTPIQSEVSVVVSALPSSELPASASVSSTTVSAIVTQTDKKSSDSSIDKLKKVRFFW